MSNNFCRYVRTAIILASLNCTIETLPMHEPIYPQWNEQIILQLEAKTPVALTNVKLYISKHNIDDSGNLTVGDEKLVREWRIGNLSRSISVADTQQPYGQNTLVNYRFEVKNIFGRVRSHNVMFATEPYPQAGHPAPVYSQGDIESVFDIVFIPDTDIVDRDSFKFYCRRMIKEAFFAEPTIKHWNRQFNFYINAQPGTATDYYAATRQQNSEYHKLPLNDSNLTFADAKVIMHREHLRDYAYGGSDGVFSTEMYQLGTMMHESGHTLFELADEYYEGDHFQHETYPNNWYGEDAAQEDAPQRHKSIDDVTHIEHGWYKICAGYCQMKNTGAYLTCYDSPCSDRVVHCIRDNVGVQE